MLSKNFGCRVKNCNISRNIGQDVGGHAHVTTIWRPQITRNYIGIYKNNEFLPFLFKYSTVQISQHSSDTNKHYL